MYDLTSRLTTQWYIQVCSVLRFCQTWLGQGTSDEAITLAGYSVYSAEECGKTRGGGTAILVKHSWSTNKSVISQSCSENVEYITVKRRPFYLPRELQCIILILVALMLLSPRHILVNVTTLLSCYNPPTSRSSKQDPA